MPSTLPPFPPPTPDPLKRLHVYDGLMMNTRRWLTTDRYHRQRQNLQYQSLHQPGIVCGLGVRVIAPPESVDARFRDDRWLQIQPGIAIDLEGNPIVVDANTDRTYRIEAKPQSGRSLTVYVVVSYSEPLMPTAQQSQETIREWFRFDQITRPPNGKQIELCRIELKEPVQLTPTDDVFSPGFNQLDFRYRLQAQSRPQAVIRAAQLKPSQNFEASSDLATIALHQRSQESLAELMASVASLYSTLRGEPHIPTVSLLGANLTEYDLLYLPDGQVLTQLTNQEVNALGQYLQMGGGLLAEVPLDSQPYLEQIKHRLLLCNSQTEATHFTSWNDLSRHHSLRRSPFLFGILPEIQSNPIQLQVCGGCVLIEGRLSPHWGLTEGLLLPRSDIRTAQEFGINILHYLWQRRQFTQLLRWEEPLSDNQSIHA